jgi:gliding motility-associated-like protein
MIRVLRIITVLLLSLSVRAQVPTASIIVPGSTLCTGAAYTFSTVTSNSPTTFSWSVFPNSSVTIIQSTNIDFAQVRFDRPGFYTFSLMVSNSFSSTISTASVIVVQTAKAAFNASFTNVGYPTQLMLTNFSTNTVSALWQFSDGGTSTVVSTVKDYTASGNYTVTLTAFGANGCDAYSSYSFRIADSSGVTLPDIFTPNNDGINDIFKPITRGIKTMTVFIYNRYGTLVNSWDKPNGFWDGYTTAGLKCQDDVYFCVLEATGFDGKSYKMKGKITLLR